MGKSGNLTRLERGETLVAEIRVYSPPELKDLAGEEADKQGVPLSEFVVRVLAKHLQRPDLATIPRKSVGRPRKRAVARNAPFPALP